MLALTRNEGQSVFLKLSDDLPKGTVIEVQVVRSMGPIKLGVEAPRAVAIERDNMKNGQRKSACEYVAGSGARSAK